MPDLGLALERGQDDHGASAVQRVQPLRDPNGIGEPRRQQDNVDGIAALHAPHRLAGVCDPLQAQVGVR